MYLRKEDNSFLNIWIMYKTHAFLFFYAFGIVRVSRLSFVHEMTMEV